MLYLFLLHVQCHCDNLDIPQTGDSSQEEEKPLIITEAMIQRAKDKDLKALATLLQKLQNGDTVDINAKDSRDGSTWLHWTAWIGDLEITLVLLANGANVNGRNNLQQTPLHLAASGGHLTVVEALVAKKAEVNARDKENTTPLHISRSGQIAQALINKGAQVNIKNQIGETPILWAAWNNRLQVVQVLIAAGANVDAQDHQNGMASLHLAAYSGYLGVVQALLASNAQVDIIDNDGGTPLHWASAGKQLAVVQALLAKKANVNAQDKIGQTPLHVAYFKKNTEIQNALLASTNGVTINIKDNYGRTPRLMNRVNKVIPRHISSTSYEVGELKEIGS